MSVTTIIQKSLVDQVGSIVVTNIVETTDPDQNTIYTREFRVFGPRDNNGSAVLLFTLSVSADRQSNLELTAPSQSF